MSQVNASLLHLMWIVSMMCQPIFKKEGLSTLLTKVMHLHTKISISWKEKMDSVCKLCSYTNQNGQNRRDWKILWYRWIPLCRFIRVSYWSSQIFCIYAWSQTRTDMAERRRLWRRDKKLSLLKNFDGVLIPGGFVWNRRKNTSYRIHS